LIEIKSRQAVDATLIMSSSSSESSTETERSNGNNSVNTCNIIDPEPNASKIFQMENKKKIEEKATSAGASSSTAQNTNSNESSLYNPISEWQEPVDIHHLTFFEMHRKPRKLITEKDAIIRLPLKVLSDLNCPICLGFIKNTSIVMECLHRFCGECIQKCLRIGKKECPSCRIHIPSRRSLRPDPNFDNLIKSIYGDIDALEKFEEKEIENLNKAKNMNNAYSESRKRGIMQQALQRKKRNREGASYHMKGKEIPQDDYLLQGLTDKKTIPLVHFILRRHPQEMQVDSLQRAYIRTSGSITIRCIKQFLSEKLNYEPVKHFQILTVVEDEGIIIDDNIPMIEVQRDILNSTKLSVLYYRITP